jgi:hypothetical protein
VVNYDTCLQASKELGKRTGLSQDIEISLAACEQTEGLTPCFIGCSLGALDGAPALYTYLTPEKEAQFARFMSHRCAAAAHEFCLCADPRYNCHSH